MDEYLNAITKLSDLLISCKDHFWSPRVDAFKREYKQLQDTSADPRKYSDYFQRVEEAISGGMGSLSDLTFSLAGGHYGDEKSLRAANQEKEALLDELYEISKARLENLNRHSI